MDLCFKFRVFDELTVKYYYRVEVGQTHFGATQRVLKFVQLYTILLCLFYCLTLIDFGFWIRHLTAYFVKLLKIARVESTDYGLRLFQNYRETEGKHHLFADVHL